MIAKVAVDAYALESLMADLVGHDRRPSAYLVYLSVWAMGEGGRVALSYAELSDRTGLSKRAVQDGVAHLVRRELLEVTKDGPTATPRYRPLTPWRRWR